MKLFIFEILEHLWDFLSFAEPCVPNDVDKCTKGVISNCVKSVCSLCVRIVIWGNLQNCVKWNAGRVNAIPNCTIWNNLALEEKPSFAHLRCKNITPNLDRKFAIQSYCLVNSNQAHAMSTQFWVWHFFEGKIPYQARELAECRAKERKFI